MISSAVEHCLHTAGVAGSNPASPTMYFNERGTFGCRFRWSCWKKTISKVMLPVRGQFLFLLHVHVRALLTNLKASFIRINCSHDRSVLQGAFVKYKCSVCGSVDSHPGWAQSQLGDYYCPECLNDGGDLSRRKKVKKQTSPMLLRLSFFLLAVFGLIGLLRFAFP